MKIDFHVHTILSKHRWLWKYGLIDGLNTPSEITQHAKRLGFDSICITDHNHILGREKAERLSKAFDILVISGAEIDIEINGKEKEYIVLGCEHIPKAESIQEIAEKIHNENGILIAPHPSDILGRGINHFENFDAVEYINGFSGKMNFKEKIDKALVTGSDAHCTAMLGYSYTIVDANSKDELFEKIRHGKTKPYGTAFPKRILPRYYLKKWAAWVQTKYR